MEIKGLNELNNTLKNIFKEFNISEFYSAEDEFECEFEDRKIGYTLVENLPHNNYYVEFVKKNFHYEPIVPFMLFIFHEIGHLYTTNATLSAYSEKRRTELYEKMGTPDLPNGQFKCYEFEYFRLPEEIVATAWAVEYMSTHEEEVLELWKKVYNALQVFYKLNITD